MLGFALFSFFSLCLVPPVMARDFSPPPEIDPILKAKLERLAELSELNTPESLGEISRMLKDETPQIRVMAERVLWYRWSHSGDVLADQLLHNGNELMDRGHPIQALERFNQAIAQKPDFAEAYNKRAAVYFLFGDYESSLISAREAVRLNPWHYEAMGGMGLCLMLMERPVEALKWFSRALAINPFMASIQKLVKQLESSMERTST